MQISNTQNIQPRHSKFLDYYNILRHRKWIILASLVVLIFFVILANELTPPVYVAEATIIYEEPKDTRFALEADEFFYSRNVVFNLIEQIKSRTLAEKVAKVLPGQVKNMFKLPEPTPPNFVPEQYIGRKLKSRLNVNLLRNTDILRIQIHAKNARAASIIANTYLDELINWNIEMNRQEVSNVRDFVEKQFLVFQNKLNNAEDALREFKEKNKMISLTSASTEILDRMTAVEVTYNQVRTERDALNERKLFIESKMQMVTPSITTSGSTRTKELKQNIQELEMEYTSGQVNGVPEDNSEMILLKQKIDQLKQQLVQEHIATIQKEYLIDPMSQTQNLIQESISLEVDIETYRAKERKLKQILDDYEVELQSLPGKELELARLIRTRDVNDKIYSMLLEKREEAKITEASKVGTIHVVDRAEEPVRPEKPKKARNVILGLVLGLVFGVGLAFLLESLDSSLKSRSDIESFLKLPVLTSVPSINTNGVTAFKKKPRDSVEAYSSKQFCEFDDNSLIGEAYRAFELNFSFVNTDDNLKSILITSPGAKEGKTLTAINIAQMFANTGARTLLIDCDLRRPMINKVLGINKTPGLTNVLINKVTLAEVIQNVTENFDFLASGTWPPNPSEILKSARMNELLVELKGQYERIIIDAPPLIPVIDAIVLANKVDGVCLVIRYGSTSQESAIRARQILDNSRARIIGVIFNDVEPGHNYMYNKYFQPEDKNNGDLTEAKFQRLLTK